MQKMKILFGAALITLVLSAPAFASFANGTLGYLEGDLESTGTSYWGAVNNVPEGLYDVTYVYSSADWNNTWTEADGDSLSSSMGVGSTLSGVSLEDSLFTSSFTFWGREYSYYSSIASRFSVQIFKVISDFTLNGIAFAVDDYLIAFNDELLGGDFDYDDMVLKTTATSATPIPGALWLLGSGLVGLIGLSRRQAA